MGAVSITCTSNNGTKIHAEADSQLSVTWNLTVTPASGPAGGGVGPTSSGGGNGHWWADWMPVPTADPAPDTYSVQASNVKGNDSQPVPHGTCP